MAFGSSLPPLRCADYHVAWICPVADLELLPARLMLDEEYPTPPYDTHYDENTYICGTINSHAIVVATCAQGETGNINAGRLTGYMFKTFPNIRMALLVGIGGGIPHAITSEDPLDDIHLGGVVVGWPGDGKPACVYHERGRARADGEFEMLVFHLGRIAKGNAVIQDSELRDRIKVRCDGALCIEMEAAGVDANRRCLVIRGISDYTDSHKSDVWRSHAAGKVAAFARELLCRVPRSPDLPIHHRKTKTRINFWERFQNPTNNGREKKMKSC
ncbi:purine and uridine phosphorylase [Karstenula rhodostoma CBS 690.94]|uniref:Purine and uridine phosphorylase n=1 Tax=Karstenula rhodostoma CBS 690.94 TaxID=1392251 RepID=A0A9P4U7J1_9PLEO|nr:purine and uridine phosphorylase [Karstenula rhodostoma CBS 690.94]